MFEAYSVAVRVSLIGNVAQGLLGLSQAFQRAHGHAAQLQQQLDKIKFKLVAGGLLAGTGLVGLSLIEKTLPYAREYARQMALMNTLGMKQADIAKVVHAAWESSNLAPTMTAAQNLSSFRELRSAFGSDTQGQEHASTMLPVVARLAGVMQSLTGKEQEHVGFDMVKAIELRTGVMTTDALLRNSDLMSKAIIGMGGTVTAADFHGALKMGKIATNKWSDDFTYDYLPTLMQELKTGAGGGGSGGGAQTAGTALMSLYQQMHGRMTKAAMPLWVQAGLVKPQDIVKNATGNYQVKPGAIAGTQVFEQNPFQWVQSYLRPGVDKLMAKMHVSAETAINAMFSNRNAAFAAYNMYFKAAQYERDKKTIGQADGGYTAYQKLLKTDPTLAAAALHAQWQNVLGQIGYSIMPTLVNATLKLVGVLKVLGVWMHEHPTIVRNLVIAFGALSVAMTVAGAVLLFAGAIAAVGLALPVVSAAATALAVGGLTLLSGGFSVLAGVIGALSTPVVLVITAISALGIAIWEIVKHWDSSKTILQNIRFEFASFFTWILNQARHLVGLPDLAAPRDPSKPYGSSMSWDAVRGSKGGLANRLTPDVAGANTSAGTSPFVAQPGANAQSGPLKATINLNGKHVFDAIVPYFSGGFGANSVGPARFDAGAALAPAGGAYSR